MVDEESPLIEYPCRICTDNIEAPIQYCECKDDLFFHKKCMEKWLNQTYTTSCDVCKTEFKIDKRVNYCKLLLNFGYIIPVMALIIYAITYFIINILEDKNHGLRYHSSTIIFIIFIFMFLVYNFVIRCCSCREQNIYTLFLTE